VELVSSGPPWLLITISGLSLVGVVITAVVGPIVVDRRRSHRVVSESSEVAVIAQRADDAVMIIQHEISDLQRRVGRLEALRMVGFDAQR
jgi:hypothetical protein